MANRPKARSATLMFPARALYEPGGAHLFPNSTTSPRSFCNNIRGSSENFCRSVSVGIEHRFALEIAVDVRKQHDRVVGDGVFRGAADVGRHGPRSADRAGRVILGRGFFINVQPRAGNAAFAQPAPIRAASSTTAALEVLMKSPWASSGRTVRRSSVPWWRRNWRWRETKRIRQAGCSDRPCAFRGS